MEALVSIFQKLGLTEYEAKALSTLVKNNELEAPEIARYANVPKTRVYDVLDKLAERGFAIELGGRPRRYKASELDRIFQSLIEEKTREVEELKKEVEAVKEKIEQGAPIDEREKIFVMKDFSDLARLISMELKTASNYVLGFTEVLPRHSAIKRVLKELKEKNIDVKLIHANYDEVEELKKFGIDAKAYGHGMEAYIIDGKKLLVSIGNLKKARGDFKLAIWHNSPLIEPLKDHFEKLWNKES